MSYRFLLASLTTAAIVTAWPALAGGSALYGSWVLTELRDGTVAAGVKTTMIVEPGGRVTGHTGCNGYGGTVTISEREVQFLDPVATEMACESATMAQEAAFLSVLRSADRFHVGQGVLVLIDEAGSKLATFEPL